MSHGRRRMASAPVCRLQSFSFPVCVDLTSLPSRANASMSLSDGRLVCLAARHGHWVSHVHLAVCSCYQQTMATDSLCLLDCPFLRLRTGHGQLILSIHVTVYSSGYQHALANGLSVSMRLPVPQAINMPRPLTLCVYLTAHASGYQHAMGN